MDLFNSAPLLRRPLPKVTKKSFLATSHVKKKYSENLVNFDLQYLQELCKPFGNYLPRRTPRKHKKCYKRTILNNQCIELTPTGIMHLPDVSTLQIETKPKLCSYPTINRSCVLNILNIPKEDKIPKVPEKKPWRQLLIEEEQRLQSMLIHHEKNVNNPVYNIQNIVIPIHYSNEVLSAFNQNPIEDNFDKHKSMKDKSFEIIYPKYFSDKKEAKLHLMGNSLRSVPQLPLEVFSILTWVNLSFNDFSEIPEQLYQAKNLICLNMRCNPITEISSKISFLTKLNYINFSYCLLSELNPSLFKLKKLEGLDIAFNHLTHIDPQISCLRSLHELYVDGNELFTFPCSILKLRLKILNCGANFLHNLFWQEAVPIIPQSLVDISKMCLLSNNMLHLIPSKENMSKCDYCEGNFIGNGISVLKPVNEIFGVKKLPLLFRVCKESCRANLINFVPPFYEEIF
ncbi:protein lap1 isoform X1 [Hydra vulgaris]|uniref:protein lap1 isoform X1 n=1 Tax=Hydra vulgaris TaxID=6087 RepID=UPI001F5E7157|nr:protein lap1 [Hydra vulgaris]